MSQSSVSPCFATPDEEEPCLSRVHSIASTSLIIFLERDSALNGHNHHDGLGNSQFLPNRSGRRSYQVGYGHLHGDTHEGPLSVGYVS